MSNEKTVRQKTAAKVVPLRTEAQAKNLPVSKTVKKEKDCHKYFSVTEPQLRQRVAWVTFSITALFSGFALYGAITHRNFTPFPFGSSLLIEAALVLVPSAWPLSVIHNAICAISAAMFGLAVTTANVQLPGDPRLSHVYLWRRQTRFVLPKVLSALSLFSIGLFFQFIHHDLVAACLESPAIGFAIKACALRFVPVASQFLVIEMSGMNDGLHNRLIAGGGIRAFFRGSLVIPHKNLIEAQKSSSFWEWCFGLASLHIRYLDSRQRPAELVIRAFGSNTLVQDIEVKLNGEFKMARDAWPAGIRNALATPTGAIVR